MKAHSASRLAKVVVARRDGGIESGCAPAWQVRRREHGKENHAEARFRKLEQINLFGQSAGALRNNASTQQED